MTTAAHTTPKRRAGIAAGVALALVVSACSGDDDDATDNTDPPPATEAPTTEAPADTTPPDTTPPETTPPDTTPPDTTEPPEQPVSAGDVAYYILPPGNYGGLPTNDDSLDQLALYDGLTPLRGDVTEDDLDEFFLPADFAPIGETTVEDVGRDDVTVVYDEFGVPHITGETRESLAFGAGWVSARDRGILIDFGLGPSRAAVADVPGIDAFSLVTGAQQFVPSAEAEQLVTDQVQLIIDTYGEEGEQIVADAQAYADGMTAYWASTGADRDPITVNDVIATTAFIGSIFGAGGGGEIGNAEFLSALQNRLGDEQGAAVWNDFLQTDDPEAPTTIDERFEYGTFTGGEVTGSVTIDEGSVISLDPRDPAEGSAPIIQSAGVFVDATADPPSLTASNWLTVAPEASTTGDILGVMGPQLGYYYPEIVQQMHLTGPGIEAQGVGVPGLAMYLLIGRTEDYAWSLTSANQDVRDIYAEVLCEPDGSTPTRTSGHYEFEGECIPFENFFAGTLNGERLEYPVSVHGPVVGTATSDGRPIALTSKRSTFGRDGLNLAALKDMTEGDGATHESFFESANKFGFTFNWGYINREGIGYFASGLLPERAPGLDRRLPTLGTGDYEWQGFLDLDEHPHATGHPTGRLLNWNNQSAPGFMHGDNNLYGSVHRVENFDQWPDQVDLAGVVGVMNRAATEEVYSSLWPVISNVLAAGDAPSDAAAEVVTLLDGWVADDAPLLDADEDGDYDRPGAFLFDAVLPPIADEVIRPVLGELIDDGVRLRGINPPSVLDKDLRTLLGEPVEGPFQVAYCGGGDLMTCSESLWAVIDDTVQQVAAERGDDPATWLAEGRRSTFTPGLIPDDFRSTNRPTFQQVIRLEYDF